MFSDSSGTGAWHIVLPTLGVFLTAMGAWSAVKSERLRKHGKTAQGRITRLIRDSGVGDGGGAHFPEFSFTAQDGSTHVIRSNDGSTPCPFSQGQSVTVLYDPDDPSSAKIDTFGQMWMSALLFGIIGPALLFIELVYWLSSPH